MSLFRPAGKHAKPSAAAPAAIAGGMTAAFLLGDGTAAHASASNSDWDRLASCESGGNWSINSGNGYYGGLQFDVSTWRAYGGSGRPDQNSRGEQIRVANNLHDARGWSPWPSCSRKLGLRGGAPREAVQESAPAVKRAAPEVAPQAVTDEAAPRQVERASRSRRTLVRAAVPMLGKYQASPRSRVVVGLATVKPPVFDGRVMTAADRDVYRLATKMWQRRMAARGWDLVVDGKFGPQSASVAQRFAAQKGLKPAAAGTVDQSVWASAWSLPVS
ncbi:MAG: resuscitation-promoting factor [Frankiales bacterium]|nr:resuscitation-promoting factor [Frankiales bacterium]